MLRWPPAQLPTPKSGKPASDEHCLHRPTASPTPAPAELAPRHEAAWKTFRKQPDHDRDRPPAWAACRPDTVLDLIVTTGDRHQPQRSGHQRLQPAQQCPAIDVPQPASGELNAGGLPLARADSGPTGGHILNLTVDGSHLHPTRSETPSPPPAVPATASLRPHDSPDRHRYRHRRQPARRHLDTGSYTYHADRHDHHTGRDGFSHADRQ